MMKRLERRSRGAEKGQGIFELGANDCDIAAMVARSLFLLVTGLLLFIHDDESKIFHWGENRRARSHNDAGFAVSNAPPFTCALDIAQRGMENGDTFEARAKPRAALAANPQSQRNFRYQNDRGFAASECFLHCAQVDFSFSAAGNAVKKLDAEFTQFESGANRSKCAVLFGVQCMSRRRVPGVKRIFCGVDRFF